MKGAENAEQGIDRIRQREAEIDKIGWDCIENLRNCITEAMKFVDYEDADIQDIKAATSALSSVMSDYVNRADAIKGIAIIGDELEAAKKKEPE